MAERSIPPSARRLREAWRAGRRPRAPWLGIGTRCLSLWLLLVGGGPLLGRAVGPAMRAAWQGDLLPWMGMSTALILTVGLALLGADLLAAVLGGSLGPVRRTRVGDADPVGAPPAARAALGLIALFVVVAAAMGVVAGAARGVDASGDGLEGLYRAWLQRVLALGALGGLGLGAVERLLAERRRFDALHLTPEQAREEQRRAAPAGGRG